MQRLLSLLTLLAIAGKCHAGSQLINVPREEFTLEHNMMIVNAMMKDPEELKQLLKKPIPAGITLEKTVFTLFNRKGPSGGVRLFIGDVTALQQGAFDKSKQVVFATHGFLSSGTTDWMFKLKDAHLGAEDVNFISVDWSDCAGTILYPSAVTCTKTVGGYVADMLTFLESQGANVRGMHLMGHSLGAHLMAQVSQYGHRIQRLTGWDPAGPLFDADDLAGRIDPSDADIVDIIHTDMSLFGYHGLLGHIDFFPNGGNNQPGCFALDELCNHSMSHDYYIQSLYNQKKYPANDCNSMAEAEKGICSGAIAYMGHASVQSPAGIYYIKVDEKATTDP